MSLEEAQKQYEQGKNGEQESIVFLGADGVLYRIEPLTTRLSNEEETAILEQAL